MDIVKKTAITYGFLWTRNKAIIPKDRYHFNAMQEVIHEPIVKGQIGIDIGSGNGYDTYIMAKNNPLTKIISIDISDGIYNTRKLTSMLDNVNIIKCSFLSIPIKEGTFDFAYSFGVLHHVEDPSKGLMEIARILKKNGPVFLYLYEDHSDNLMKDISVKIVAKLRNVTINLPSHILYVLCYVLSPFVFIFFTFPSKILRKFRYTKSISRKMPFNFGTGFFSLQGDLYDRFSAPIEHRFGRQMIFDVFDRCGFHNVHITRLKEVAGWVAWGYKK